MPVSVLLVMAALSALPEGVSAYARVEPAVIPFHQPATYSVVVEMPPGTAYQMPSMMNRFDGLVAPGGAQQNEEMLKDGRIRATQTYRIEAIFPGNYAIEPAVVTVNGEQYSLPSPVLRVRELTEQELAHAAEFDAGLPQFDAGIATPIYRKWWFWALLAGAVLLGAFAGYMIRRGTVRAPEVSKSPWEVAISRLEALRARDLPSKGQSDRFYVDLSAILRYYIEARFELHAPERTTQEFLREMSDAGIFDDKQEAFLEAFLRHCDYVKFARLQPALEEMNERFEQVAAFIKETVPVPAAESSAEAA